MRHMLNPLLVTFAHGEIAEYAKYILRLAVRPHHRQLGRGDNARAVIRRYKRVLVNENRLPRLDQFQIFRVDGLGGTFGHHFGRGHAEQRFAFDAEEFLGRSVEQEITQIGQILDKDWRGDVLDDHVEERAGTLQFAFGLFALGDILVRGYPAAIFRRLIDDRDDTAILQFNIERKGAALFERRA